MKLTRSFFSASFCQKMKEKRKKAYFMHYMADLIS